MKRDLLQIGRDLISGCERGFQDLLKEAVAEREYDAIVPLTNVAKALRELARTSLASGSKAPDASPAARSEKRLRTIRAKGRPTPQRKRAEYPKFYRRNDDLVKVGWSKREKKEYQHKAPQPAVRAVATAMANAGQDGHIVRIDKLLPLQHGSGSEVANYQVYVCMAWLRNAGLIEQQGRQGYRLTDAAGFEDAVAERWERLATNGH